ncbi:MAG: hypothetical protein WCZ12_00930 [Patescibacteria group bacterium]
MKSKGLNRISSKKINNPFIKDKRSRRFKRKCQTIMVLSIIVIIILLYILFISNAFKIKNIEISGNLSNKDVIENILNEKIINEGEIIFLIKKDYIEGLIKNYNLEDIKIQKIAPRTLKIDIKERSDVYMYEENNTLYFLDSSSYISKKFNICKEVEVSEEEFNQEIAGFDDYNAETEEDLSINSDCVQSTDEITKDRFIPLIVNMGASRLDSSNNYVKISEEYLYFSKELYEDLGFDSDFRVKNFILDESINTIKVNLHNDVVILLNLKDDYMDQFQRFEDIKKELKDELKTIKYIDMRYGDKIYYN